MPGQDEDRGGAACRLPEAHLGPQGVTDCQGGALQHAPARCEFILITCQAPSKESRLTSEGFFAQSIRIKLALPQAARLSIFLLENQ